MTPRPLAAILALLLAIAPAAAARDPAPVAEAAYRAAFSAARLGSPAPSAALATEFLFSYRGGLPHAAFALAREAETGRSAWGWVSAAASPEAAADAALERCRRVLGTLKAECRVLARDAEVEGAAPVPARQGSLGPFRWSPLHLQRGPAAARGAVIWGHGYGGPQRDNRSRPTPGLVSILNDAGWDVLRFDRDPAEDALFTSLPRLLDGLGAVREAGYRAVILGGQSRGAWQALMAAAEQPEAVQAVIAAAPGAHGEAERPNILPAALEDFRRLLAGLGAGAPRLLVALFDGDGFDPDPAARAAILEALARDRAAPTLALWPAQDIGGHGGVADWRFTRLFGGCVLTLVQAPEAAAPRGLRRTPCGGG